MQLFVPILQEHCFLSILACHEDQVFSLDQGLTKKPEKKKVDLHWCIVYTLEVSRYFLLKNSTYKIDEIYSLFIIKKYVKIKHEVHISTINKL